MASEARDISAFQLRLGYSFTSSDYLLHALTHASAGSDSNYERLEFLGDRVLGLALAHLLYEDFPGESEGLLARRHAVLVSGPVLSQVASQIRLGDVLNLSGAERAAGGARNANILADVMEAVIGAVYLDGGIESCHRIIAALWQESLQGMAEPPVDPKTSLQEWTQARALGLPEYKLESRDGPDHAPVFYISVRVDGFSPVTGTGASRRAAEKDAAAALMKIVQGSS